MTRCRSSTTGTASLCVFLVGRRASADTVGVNTASEARKGSDTLCEDVGLRVQGRLAGICNGSPAAATQRFAQAGNARDIQQRDRIDGQFDRYLATLVNVGKPDHLIWLPPVVPGAFVDGPGAAC